MRRAKLASASDMPLVTFVDKQYVVTVGEYVQSVRHYCNIGRRKYKKLIAHFVQSAGATCSMHAGVVQLLCHPR